MAYSRYIGRVGVLAVMLGVGTAVAAPAWADDGSSGAGPSASNSSTSAQPRHGTPAAGGKSAKGPRKSTANKQAAHGAAKSGIVALAGTGAPDNPVAQPISMPQAVAPVVVQAVSPLRAPVRGTPVQPAGLLDLMAASRRQGDEAAAAPPAAATTTITISTWTQLVNAAGTYGGYISSPTAGTSQNNIPATLDDTSWTFKNTYLGTFGDADPQPFYATQTAYTYSTPYSQNAFVQSQLKAKALQLHQTYSASNYTAWLVATSPTDPSTISGAKQLTLGDAIVHPAPIIALAPDGNGGWTLAMPASTDPSWQSDYSVVILPKNIVPVFPGGDITAPKAPTIATSKLTPESVTLKTSGSTDDVGVVGYNFYRVSTYDYGQGNIQTTIVKANGLVVSAGTTFVDTAVEPDTTYVYTARAVDAAGHESLDSAPLLVKTPAPDAEPPTAPTITATGSTTTTATLTVFGSTDNVGVEGYDIYRDYIQINIAPVKAGQSFVDTDLTPGTEYTYSAQAFDAAGNYSDESASIVVTTTGSTGGGGGEPPGDGGGGEVAPLPVPAITPSKITDHSVVITLTRAKHDIRVVSYLIYRDGQAIATLHSLGDEFTDENLDSDVTYIYTAKALDAEYHSSEFSKKLRVTTYSEEEWEFIDRKNDSTWEKQWETFNKTFGWIPLVGDGLAAISLGIDIAELGRAIASRNKDQIFDELKDIGGDLIGFIPFAKAIDGRWATALEALAKQPIAEPLTKTSESVLFWLAGQIYDATVPPR
jgi:chitodextrinase